MRARVGTWPYDPDVAHIVLLDHHTVPDVESVRTWVGDAIANRSLDGDPARPTMRAIRTGAMFPEAAAAFLACGFTTIDTLALLDVELDRVRRPDQRPDQRPDRRSDRRRAGTQRMKATQFDDVAQLDRAAFGDPWGNDVTSLTDVTRATPKHRARVVTLDKSRAGAIGGFAISGQSGSHGYLQRLAVHPDHRRQGIADRLVTDSLRWMQRRGATRALVNTAVDNDAALALYERFGFVRRRDVLSILELSVPT